MTEPTSNAAAPPRRARIGREISTVGLVVLAATLFVPIGPGEDISPPLDWLLMRSSDLIRPPWAGPLLSFPWLFAWGMLAVYVLRAWRRRDFPLPACLIALTAVLTLDGLALFIAVGLAGRGGFGANRQELLVFASFVFGALAATAALFGIWVRASRAARTPACVTLVGLMSLSFLMLIGFGGPRSPLKAGLWAALIASALAAFGGFLEAEALWDAPAEETP